MEKIFGTNRRQDGLMQISRRKWTLFYGYGEDGNGMGYEYRQTFDHKPTLEEIKESIIGQVNANCKERIASGMRYNGKSIWLSAENQRNYSDWYAARSTLGYPVRVRVGETGSEEYLEFGTSNALTSFYKAMVEWVRKCVNECWDEKDSIDWSVYEAET